MAMQIAQRGIKWWQHCRGCEWQGRARKLDNERTECPNCGNPSLLMEIDKKVYNGIRYDIEIFCDKDRDAEDTKRQNEGRQPALPDVVEMAKNGFRFGTGENDVKKPKYKKRTPPQE